MEPMIETKHLTHTYSAGSPFERTALHYPWEYSLCIHHPLLTQFSHLYMLHSPIFARQRLTSITDNICHHCTVE